MKLTDKLTFGKHKGETIQDVCDNNVTYIEWALETIDTFELDDEAMGYYEACLEEHLGLNNGAMHYAPYFDFGNDWR